jgi:tetratricopeptide (TPR) repeat protein
MSLPLPQLAALAGREGAGPEELCDLAGGLVRAGELAEGIAVYERAVERFPDEVRGHYNLGTMYARTGQYEKAIRHWQRTVELVPDFADGHFNLGVAHAQRAPTAIDQPANLSYADLDLAIEHCTRAVDLEPENGFFHYNLGRALQLRHLSEKAAEVYRRALALDEGLIDAHRFLGEIGLEQGDLVGARTAFEAVVRLDSTDAEGQYQLGKVLERQEGYAEAVGAFERAVALKADYRDAHFSLAKLYSRLGRTEKGKRAQARFEGLEEEGKLEAARRRVQRWPNDALERRALAVAYVEEGQYGKAVEEFKVALVLTEAAERGGIYHDLGLVYDRIGDLGRAIASLQKAASIAPDTARFHLHLGQAYAKVGRDSLAVIALERALEVQPGWGRAQYELAMLYVKGRRSERAQSLFEAVLRGDPQHVPARFGLSLTYIDRKRYREAAEQLEAVLEQEPNYPRGRQLLDRVRRELDKGNG